MGAPKGRRSVLGQCGRCHAGGGVGLAELTEPDDTEGEIEIQRGRGPAEFILDQDSLPGPPSPSQEELG